MADSIQSLDDVVKTVIDARDADVIIYSGGIRLDSHWHLIAACERCERKRAIIYMNTSGGSPDSAFRMARALQGFYPDGYDLIIPEWCKSAGSLIALGASRLFMGEHAELGPLDVQVLSKEEVGERDSGLTPMQALSTLQDQCSQAFDRYFDHLRFEGTYSFSTKAAADIAAKMTIGMFAEIYRQFDPMRLGSMQRAMLIGSAYGERLATSNICDGTVAKLIGAYPSHGFVIDLLEARSLFRYVGTMELLDLKLVIAANDDIREGQRREARDLPPVIKFFSSPIDKINDNKADEQAKPRKQPDGTITNDSSADTGAAKASKLTSS